MNRQQQQQQQLQQTQSQQQSVQQQSYQTQQQTQQIVQQQRISRVEQHVTRQVTSQQHQVQGQVMQSPGLQMIGGRPGDASPPVFEQIFKNARFAQGGNALFEGRVRGNPKPVVSWTRKGAPLFESNKYKMKYEEQTGNVSLLINQIGPGDEGEYTCSARNQYGEAICSVYIQPEGQPQLGGYQRHVEQTYESTQQTTSGGQTVQSYQQQRTEKTSYSNGHTLVEEDFKVDTFEYRLLREVEYRESVTRRYSHETDARLSTTVERNLGPAAAPQITQKPRNSKLSEGSDAVFAAKVPANPKPRLTWFKNGVRIVPSQKFQSNYSNQQATLKVTNAQTEDSGHYTLLAENPQGCVVSSAYLAIEPQQQQQQETIYQQQRQLSQHEAQVVQQQETSETDASKMLAPNFVRVCGDRDVTEGKMTRFDCRVTGRPYPEVAWYINGRQVIDDATHKILVNESGNHALMITNVSRADGGAVTCVARNKAGETSFQCSLNVIEKELVVAPKFVERFTTVTVNEGEPVLLSARAVGTPCPRITWQKDGVPISSSQDVHISVDGGASSLDIPRAKTSDAAWYQCTAQNVAGSTATRARLYVIGPDRSQQTEVRRLHLPRPTRVIEPEPEPGPEVIYLRHVERAKPHMPAAEPDRQYPPPQFIVPLRDAMQVEGGRIHFEARIEPVGDPTMQVEWFLNGRLLGASSRATTTFRFGFIALDLISIIIQDGGEYVCRATSSSGVAESRARLTVTARASIEQSSQHPDSLQQIQQLEDYSRYQRTESLEEMTAQRPEFIRPLHDLGDLQEGRNAHFEAQLTPVSDPTMKVEWYKDGRPITASSRITSIFNFGYVSLNILHLRAEDSGVYTVRALNRWGEAISSSTVRVIARTTVTGDLGIPEQQRYIEKVEELEAYHQAQQYRNYQPEPQESYAPPEFKTPIKDQLNIRENAFAHFEARLEPLGDPTLRVEWFKDGRPVEASSRITSFFNFGYVALTIKNVTIYDQGTYTCRAINQLGEAVTSAQLTVSGKKDIISESQHPGGLEKIQYLEDSSRYARMQQEESQVTQKPRFLGPLKGTTKIVEGQRAHFEARVEPLSDTTMKIEWYHNGKPLQHANRIQLYHDFGYVALDILSVRAEDGGTYTVVARNALGEAQQSASMVVETRSSIDTSSMHRGTFDKTRQIEDSKFVEPHYDIEEISKSKPIFVQPLSDPKPASEGKNIHLECRLEPMGDPTMRVEWFQNGRPVTVGSRFRTYYDFGYVALDIVKTTAMDSGEYTCRATNHLGSAHTSACVRIISRADIVTETMNESSLEQIQMLEDASRHQRHAQEEIIVAQPPQFTRPLHNLETIEGTNVHLECRLQPVGDPTMRVDWFVNGRPVRTGHRFRPAYDFDYVALDLLSVYPEDSGVYTCQARNQLGEAVTSCSVRVIAKKDLLLETQHPGGLEKIQYLEDTSRYKKSEMVDEIVNVRPRFVTRPKNVEGLREGSHAHFECKLEPVTDPNLKVEWFKNGRPITVGHRFRPIHDFGYVALDIIDLIAEDSGTYTCRAVNLMGSDETTCTLSCRGGAQIVTTTENEQGLQQIQYLEDRSRYQRHEQVDETTTQAPVFTTSLKPVNIREGQRAHFECRLIPVSDATMKVEWFHNNQPLKSGSRFTETNNFGFVALDILYCYPEDAGTYTCRARNCLGEAVTSTTLAVQSRQSIQRDTQHESALGRINQLESTRHQRSDIPDDVITQPPVFTQPMRDVRVAENQAAHFEARLIPVGDPKLRVEWLRNGVPIQASNRVTTMHDFGYVALNMKYVNPEDSGTYTCRAINELGQAFTSAGLDVASKASLLLETQHHAAVEKIQQLEDHTRYGRREEEDVVVTQAPHFTTQLNGPTQLVEGQSAHYECRIEPYPDPNLKVEWFHNGKPLSTGHRYRTTYDFGFASLDVLTVYAEDAGEYTCRATNKLGQAASSIQLGVTSRASIIRETQHEGALQKIQHLEDDSRYRRKVDEDAVVMEKPQFGRSLRNIENLPEGQSAHLEATLTPVNDPTMVVEWFCNGRPIKQGHRFKTTYDFGFVALDVLYAYPEDSGTYMCRARNAVGEAVTTCSVKVVGKEGLCLDTLDEQRLQKIRELENYARPQREEIEPVAQKPVFVTPLTSLPNLKEGEHAHLECRVEPINDPNLRIEWFVNGKALKTGHRFRTTHDFGYVALDILYAYAEDSGTYMCKATNLQGEAVNTCEIACSSRRSIYLESQHPDGLEKIQMLEAAGHPARLEVEEPVVTAPRLVTELRGTTEIFEGQTAHFECQVEPLHDPNLRIDFYHNGKPLPSGNRFHITFDFGYVALDITHAVPEDAGEYTVRVTNALGECQSSIKLKVNAKGSIISESQRPEAMEKISKLEAGAPKKAEVEEPQTRQRPVFTQPLQNIDNIAEGQTAHFECRLIPVGDPTLKVEWFRNEKPLETSSRITKTHDFGFVSLDMSHVREEDEGVYMCRASNALGEAVTTASMKIRSKASIQLDTLHPEGMKRVQQLEEGKGPQRPDEPERVFEKPIFTQMLTGPSELWEGQHAHFECRVVPVGDPNLRFEWFVNGVELKMGSRFRVTHDFGFVTLDISKTVPEDSGVYMCKAINLAGEAVTSTSLKVKSKSSISSDALQPDAWQKIQLKEAEMNKVPEMFVDTTPQQAPVFTTHLTSQDKLVEGQHVYLEAQVEPRADPNLRVEWFKNGESLTTGSRIRSTFDFGLVTLSINGLRADDSAIYTCKATNLLGEAVSTATLKIDDQHWLLNKPLHPEAIPRIEQLEAPKAARPDAPEPTYELPVFITHLNNVECKEGDTVHFECHVEPAKDPTLGIEWFVNGKPLTQGARFKSTYDFGYVSLDIVGAYPEDSGIYTCKATNNKGSATTSGSLRCTGKTSIYLDTQHPQGKQGLEAVDEVEAAVQGKATRKPDQPEPQFPKPVWTIPLNPEFRLGENDKLHLEGTVEPKNDPNLKIEWYFNGKALEHGSRFKMTNDFGFVTLDLADVYERDQGVYTCKAYNQAGEAFTSTTIYCTGKENLIERTQHPKGEKGLEQIQNLEDALTREPGSTPEAEGGQPPVFTSQLEVPPELTVEFQNLSNLSEGDIAHFEASLTPVGDQTMVVEWFYNGKQIDASHRTRTVHAFGMVVLEILGTKIEDSGTYTCRATNKWGKAEISVNLECVDKSKGQKPQFTTQIQSLDSLKEGDSAHFECTLIPVNDPNLKVEWFHNGQPLRHSSRIKSVSDFGFVVMDIAYVQSHDTGEYICKASNKYGEDTTRATIKCTGKGGVYLDSLQPDALARIKELESQQGQQPSQSAAPADQPPKFITQITDVVNLKEGQSAHFEARLTPVNDPNLVVEWYYNGKKLPHGHRYRTFHDFGIVILDILYCYEENSGLYECRAYNKVGEDSTKANLKCVSKANLILESQLPQGMEGGLEKIQTLEDSLVRTRDEQSTELKGVAPMFTVPLSNIDNLREGESCHFEARLTPTNDPKLKVEWFWNGKPLKTGSRFRTFCDFGFVILEISPVYPEDSGEYSCRAFNDYGEAVTTATMKIQGKRSIIMESQLPQGMEGTIDKIAELEGLGQPRGPTEVEDDTGKPPEFVTSPTDQSLPENSLAHFECRLIPVNDPSMRVEWFHNGKALWAGSRIKTINDFGFVILEVAGIYVRDAGLYTCKATNKHGEATVSCKLQVRGRQGIVLEPQLPSHFKTGTESIQKLEEQLYKKDEIMAEDEKPNPPRFIVELKDQLDLEEGQPAHFDCRVEPASDPTMRIDWFWNGRPFATGSRVHQLNDFGFIVMDLVHTYARDSGEFMCRATNKWGTATTKATLQCRPRKNIDFDSQLPQGMSGEKLKALERGPLPTAAPPEEPAAQPPKFITQIESAIVEESESVHFECRVEPKNDPKLRIEWYRNGKPLPSGHRYRSTYDMGFVSLDILNVYNEDEGEYVCRAVNEVGEDFTKATISCKKLPTIVLHNQVPKGMLKSEQLMQMEAAIKKYTSEIHLTEDDLFDPDRKQPPRFVTQIQNQMDLVEMQNTKFECQLAPVGDPNMKVEWFFNGKPLPHKNRFTPIYDFGYVAMNFGWVYPEDSGEYLCRATNLYGMDETRAVIKTAGKPGIIYESQLPKGMKSIERIREMEAAWQVVPESLEEEDKAREAPVFVTKPEPFTVQEGECARYCCRVTGFPRPRVMWLVNGHTVVNGSRYKLTYDGMWHLDIPKTRQYDNGTVEVIARNSVGEARVSTELIVKPRGDDYRSVLKNSPRRILGTKEYRKPEWVTQMEELKDALKAVQAVPSIEVEIRDAYVEELDTVVFECVYSGTPKPDIIWYHDDQIVRNTEKVRITIEEGKTTCTVNYTSPEDAGIYVCKATSDIGMAITKAKLSVTELPEDRKEEKTLNLAKQEEEKIKLEKVKMEKKREKKKRRPRWGITDERDHASTEEVQTLETLTQFSQTVDSAFAQRRQSIQDSVAVSAVASCKKVDEPEKPNKRKDTAQQVVSPREGIAVSEMQPTHEVEDLPDDKKPKTRKAKTADIEGLKDAKITVIKVHEIIKKQKLKMAKEIEDIMELVNAREFGPGESPLRELAQIGFLVRHGVSVSDITSVYHETDEFPALRTPAAQSALVSLVEREGHGTLISQVLTEETTADETTVAKTVGFRAFMRMIELCHVTVEEVLTHFNPEDFHMPVWETSEATKVETSQLKTVNVSRRTEVVTEDVSLSITKEAEVIKEEAEQVDVVITEVQDGDLLYCICSYVAENDDAMNLVEGERVYVLESHNSDWWFVRKTLTAEKGWVPAKILKDEVSYTHHLTHSLHEKIDKLPVFEKPVLGQSVSAPRFIEKLQPQHAPDGSTVQLECRVEGNPKPQITWFRETAIIKPSPDFQMFYDEDNVATLIIREVFPEDAGFFTCVAKNSVGFASSTTELYIEAPLSDHGSDITAPSRKSMSRESSLADILEGIPPTFSRKPKAKCVPVGEDVDLECRLVAIPEPEVTWLFNGKELTTEKNVTVATDSDMHSYSSIVHISKIMQTQEGTYTVVARNREGEASMTITVKVQTGDKEGPQILEPLRSVTIREGDSAVLSTQIVGNPKPKITWYKDGKAAPKLPTKTDGDTYTLTLIQPKATDSAQYTVKAVNEMGKCETTATLTVEELPRPEAPLFIERFQEQKVKENSTIKLVAKVTGNPTPQITWFRNNEPLLPSNRIKEKFDGSVVTLEITGADSELDAGDYKCLASNPSGKASHGARVTVDVDRVIFTKKLQKSVIVDERSSLNLECETSHTVSTKWYHNGKELSGMDHREIVQENKSHRLQIMHTSLSDCGTYICKVKDQSTECTVSVNEIKAEFVRKVEDIEVKEREIAVLEVEVSSNTADVTWHKDGEQLKEVRDKVVFEKKGAVRRLLIRSTSVHDEGEYTCALGDQECSAEVTVIELPPEIITKLKDTTVAKGDKATLDIELTKGDALVRWFKDGKELQFSEHIQLAIDGKRQKLKIYKAELSDAAVYSCQVGDQTSSARLTVQEPDVTFTMRMPEVIRVPVEADATLTVELSRPDVEVKWFKKSEEIKEMERFTFFSEGNVRKLIIKKVKIEDQSDYSCVMLSAKTSTKLIVEVSQSIPIIEVPKNEYKVRKGNDVSMEVNFISTPPPTDEWSINGTVIKKSKKSIPSLTESAACLTIKKVEEKDVGNYKIKLKNKSGEASADLKLILIEPPGAPGTPDVLEVTNDSITLCWKAPESDGNSPIIEYIIEYHARGEFTWSNACKDTRVTETTHKVTRLVMNSELTFRVVAVNEAGPGEPSPATRFVRIAIACKPSAPRGPFEISSMAESSFTLKWQPPESDGGSPLLEYLLERREVGKKAWQKVGTTSGDVTFIDVPGLKANTPYNFRVTASNIVGNGPSYAPEEPITVGKMITSPSAPTNLTVIDVTSRSITLQWGPPENLGGTDLTGYIVERQDQESQKWVKIATLDPSCTHYCCENLKEKSEFSFRVLAENVVGLSPPASTDRVCLKTHATPPSPPTAPLEILAVGPYAVVIEWGTPESDGGSPLTGYTIAIRDTRKTMWMEVGRVKADVQKLTIKDLQENHEYLIRIFAVNEVGSSEPLESDEPFKVLKPSELDAADYERGEATDKDTPSVSFSTEPTTSSWMRENNMDADIETYAKGSLLRKDEYFFKVWCYAKKLFK